MREFREIFTLQVKKKKKGQTGGAQPPVYLHGVASYCYWPPVVRACPGTLGRLMELTIWWGAGGGEAGEGYISASEILQLVSVSERKNEDRYSDLEERKKVSIFGSWWQWCWEIHTVVDLGLNFCSRPTRYLSVQHNWYFFPRAWICRRSTDSWSSSSPALFYPFSLLSGINSLRWVDFPLELQNVPLTSLTIKEFCSNLYSGC